MTNTPLPITAAIIGAGNMGRTHLRAYRAAGVAIVAICDVNPAQAEALVTEAGAPVYSDVEAMLDQARPSVVSICTPPSGHAAAALAAVQHGTPFLCEKPLADTAAAAESIVAAARAGGVACMTGFCHRFHEPVLQVKELLEAGAIGAPVLFRNRFAYQFKDVERSWFADRAVSGGGTVMDTSVHSLDLYRFLIGEITTVAAQLTTVTPGLTVEDNSVLLVNGPAGVPGVIEASWTSPVGESVLTVYGSSGALTVDYEAGDFGVARIRRAGAAVPTELPRSGHNRFTSEITHFVSSVGAGTPPRPDGDDGLRVLQIIAAAYGAGGSSAVSV